MPNWCYNDLQVTGEGALRFVEANSFGDGDNKAPLWFGATVPEEEGHCGRLLAWGTTGIYNTTVVSSSSTETEMVTYSFETPRSPPWQWVETVGKKNPSLSFELLYAEGGEDFRGRLKMQGGVKVEDVNDKYYRNYVTNEEFNDFLNAHPTVKNWRGMPSEVNGYAEMFSFYSLDDGNVDPELRRKLIRDGEPDEWENFFRGWLMEKARTNARNAVASSVMALVALMRLQRAFKERYYKIDGPFQNVGAVRFEGNVRSRHDDSQPSTATTKQEATL